MPGWPWHIGAPANMPMPGSGHPAHASAPKHTQPSSLCVHRKHGRCTPSAHDADPLHPPGLSEVQLTFPVPQRAGTLPWSVCRWWWPSWRWEGRRGSGLEDQDWGAAALLPELGATRLPLLPSANWQPAWLTSPGLLSRALWLLTASRAFVSIQVPMATTSETPCSRCPGNCLPNTCLPSTVKPAPGRPGPTAHNTAGLCGSGGGWPQLPRGDGPRAGLEEAKRTNLVHKWSIMHKNSKLLHSSMCKEIQITCILDMLPKESESCWNMAPDYKLALSFFVCFCPQIYERTLFWPSELLWNLLTY